MVEPGLGTCLSNTPILLLVIVLLEYTYIFSGEGQGSLESRSPWGRRVGRDGVAQQPQQNITTTER